MGSKSKGGAAPPRLLPDLEVLSYGRTHVVAIQDKIDVFASFSCFLRRASGTIDAIASFGASVLIPIHSPDQLGLLIRATRRTQKLRIDDTAGTAGVGHVFVREVERGKPTVQLGRVMQLLAELGIELKAEVADAALPEFQRLQSIGLKPLKIRRR